VTGIPRWSRFTPVYRTSRPRLTPILVPSVIRSRRSGNAPLLLALPYESLTRPRSTVAREKRWLSPMHLSIPSGSSSPKCARLCGFTGLSSAVMWGNDSSSRVVDLARTHSRHYNERRPGEVSELADERDLGSRGTTRAGSNPAFPTFRQALGLPKVVNKEARTLEDHYRTAGKSPAQPDH
jgi:hypothetical protein